MDADRRSAALTGSFLFLGTVVGVIALGVVLEPLLSASDHLTVYGESETRVLVASLFQLFMGLLYTVPEWSGHVILDVAIFPLGAVVLAIWLMTKGFIAPAPASVASASGSEGSS